MFNLIDKSKGYLFSSRHLFQIIESQKKALHGEVEGMDANRLLNTAPGDLVRYLVERYRIDAPVLKREEWSASERETKVDVSHEQNRWISDRSRPFLIPGQRIEIEVPFDGESELFYAQPSTVFSSQPRAEIRRSSLFLGFDIPHDSQSPDIRKQVERILDTIETYLSHIRTDVSSFNQGLATEAEQVIAARCDRILSNQGRLTSLGIPLKARADAPRTYAVPEVRRKVAPTLPVATTAAYDAEPVLDLEHYEHILSVMQNMIQVMERSPSAFQSMGEEDLRQHFLVQLNGHFEGAATGETFNVNGKTDILLRANGRNVFIAECKFWKGPKYFREAIDQLLGYTAWRDTKTAMLVFNRKTAMSKVISSIQEECTGHKNYKRTTDWKHESGWRFVFHHESDVNREFLLTVLVFDVPGPDGIEP